jgi:hypothetical protein
MNSINATNSPLTRPEKLFSANHLNKLQTKASSSTALLNNNQTSRMGINESDAELSQFEGMGNNNNSQFTSSSHPDLSNVISKVDNNGLNIIASTLKNATTTGDINYIGKGNNSTTITTATATTTSGMDQKGVDTSKALDANAAADGALSALPMATSSILPDNNSNNKKRRPSMAKALVILGLSKKSNSASNLVHGKRFGFARSEEIGVAPELRNRNLSPPESEEGQKQPKTR